MRRLLLTSAATLVGVCALLAPSSLIVGGDKKGKDEKEPARKADKNAQIIRALHAAYEMASFGKEKNIPEALVAAARVLGTAGREKTEPPKGSKVGKLGDFDEVKEATELLNDALAMAKGSDTESSIKALVEDARKDLKGVKRGTPYGGHYHGYFTGNPEDRADTYLVRRAHAGEFLNISLHGVGRPGLDLDLELVDDESNSVVAAERSIGPNSYISYLVPFGGPRDYRIRVINYTWSVPCTYSLSHN